MEKLWIANLSSSLLCSLSKIFVCLRDRGRERQAQNWLFAQLLCKHFSICYRENWGQREGWDWERQRMLNVQYVKMWPLDTVSTLIRGKGETQLNTHTQAHTLKDWHNKELLRRGQLIKWRYSEEMRIKVRSEMHFLKSLLSSSLLRSLSPSFSPSPDACLLLCLAPGREKRGGYGCNPQPDSVSTKLILS